MPARRRLRRVRQACGLAHSPDASRAATDESASPGSIPAAQRTTTAWRRPDIARYGTRSVTKDPSSPGSPGKRLASSTGPSRSAVNVSVSRALSRAGPSSTRPTSTTLGPNPMPSGRATYAVPHASHVTRSPAATWMPAAVHGGLLTGTSTRRASAATSASRSRSATPSIGGRGASALTRARAARIARASVTACRLARRSLASRNASTTSDHSTTRLDDVSTRGTKRTSLPPRWRHDRLRVEPRAVAELGSRKGAAGGMLQRRSDLALWRGHRCQLARTLALPLDLGKTGTILTCG